MARLHLNEGGYHGERIDLPETEMAILEAASKKGWQLESRTWKPGAPAIHFLQRLGGGHRRIYLSAGMHGDEPAPLLAVRALLESDQWPDGTDLFLCPCLNPEGVQLGTRTNADGIDINRDYRHLRTREAAQHVAWLEKCGPFDLCLCLHEDWEAHGFYLYELNPDQRPSLAAAMIESAGQFCPIDHSPLIDGRETNAPGLIRPSFDPTSRPEWPEAIWLLTHNSKLGYTLEAPSDWPLQERVQALIAAVHTGLDTWRSSVSADSVG